MVVAFSILLVIGLFLPLLLWWIRNFARIILKHDIPIISDNLLRIFLFCYGLALFFGILLVLAALSII